MSARVQYIIKPLRGAGNHLNCFNRIIYILPLMHKVDAIEMCAISFHCPSYIIYIHTPTPLYRLHSVHLSHMVPHRVCGTRTMVNPRNFSRSSNCAIHIYVYVFCYHIYTVCARVCRAIYSVCVLRMCARVGRPRPFRQRSPIKPMHRDPTGLSLRRTLEERATIQSDRNIYIHLLREALIYSNIPTPHSTTLSVLQR